MRHSAHVLSVLFASDDAALATTTRTGEVRLWDLGTGEQLGEPRRHGTTFLDMVYAPNGHRIVTIGRSDMRLWHAATGRLYPLPLRHPDSPHIARPTFSEDGRRLVALFRDRGIFRWDVPDPPDTFREMQLRTWIDLAIRLNEQRVVEPIPWEEWRELRRELEQLQPTDGLPSS